MAGTSFGGVCSAIYSHSVMPVTPSAVDDDRQYILQGAFIFFVLYVLYFTVWLPISYRL